MIKKDPHAIAEFSTENKAYLSKISDKAKRNDVKLTTEQYEALEIVYNAITKRVLSKGCSTCIPDAYKMVRNYLLKWPIKKEKVKEVELPEEVAEVFKEIQEDFETPKLIKEIKKSAPKKKATKRKARKKK